MKSNLSYLYAIIDYETHQDLDLPFLIEHLLKQGVEIFQMRDNVNTDEQFKRWVRPLIQKMHSYDVKIIINNRVEVVEELNAHGVHLGQEDMDPKTARSKLGNQKIIGYSTHNSFEIKKANQLPVNYIGFGPIFKTNQKLEYGVRGLNELKSAIELSLHPVVAIGGIEFSHVSDLLGQGVWKIAMIQELTRYYDDIKLQKGAAHVT